jgi:hypothetical protein
MLVKAKYFIIAILIHVVLLAVLSGPIMARWF